MTQASYVIVARADHIGDVIVECQMTIIDNTKHTRMVVDIVGVRKTDACRAVELCNL